MNRQAAEFLCSFDDNHYITVLWGGFFWPFHRVIKGFHQQQTIQYGFKHKDLWEASIVGLIPPSPLAGSDWGN